MTLTKNSRVVATNKNAVTRLNPISLRESADWHKLTQKLFLKYVLPKALASQQNKLTKRLKQNKPRVALVKQDCNEDLYCCPQDLSAWETISSTLLRSGPVDLFTLFETSFLLLRTEQDSECNIWQEKVEPLGWAPREWFESFRDHVPGRDYGQSRFAQSAETIDWAAFDIVISIDVSVPARITCQFPTVVWCYYVREIKAPSWQASLRAPIKGQDLFLSQSFSPLREQRKSHVIAFPYHFQHVGVFHNLVPGSPDRPDAKIRTGVFIEYHSSHLATEEQLQALATFGSVYAHRAIDGQNESLSSDPTPDRSMSGRALHALLNSKYHIKWTGRPTFGTAKVEAIAAGCLAMTDAAIDASPFLHSSLSLVSSFDDLIEKLARLEANPLLFKRELTFQRSLIDYCCCFRPANDLLDACERILASRP